MIERTDYMSILKRWKDKKVIKVVTGIRRCGKSSLLKMFQEHLLKNGVDKSQIQDINFENLDNEPLLDYHTLYAHVKSHIKADAMNYLFFDEIQMVDHFQKVIDSLFLLNNVDIYVTGSNAYLLSREFATLLTGRYIEIKLIPFSLIEFMRTLPTSTSQEEGYRKYIEYGAFPYITKIKDNADMVREYLNGLYNTIILKDIVDRRKISDTMILQSIVRFLADNIGNLSVIKRISDTMTSMGCNISSHTVERYIQALSDSYIFYAVPRYDTKGKQLLKTGQKIYLADIGLRRVICSSKGGDMGHILENIIFLELSRRGGEIYVGKAGDAEIDFIVIKKGQKTFYQVSLSVREETTLQCALKPLESIADSYPKYLITLDNEPVCYHNGIKQIYALDWLTDRK